MSLSDTGGLQSKIQARMVEFTTIWDDAYSTYTSTLGINVSLKGMPFGGMLDQWNEEILKRMTTNLSMSIPEVAQLLNNAMESPVWQWTTDTRDIIDTGRLRDSLQIKMNGFGLIVSYNTPYAGIVHYGGIKKNGGIYPARPWAEAVLLGNGPVPQADWAAILGGKY